MDVIPRWVERYQGIPFAEYGASRDGCNCWGLCAMVLTERAGVEVGHYEHIGASEGLRISRAIEAGRREYVSVVKAALHEFDLVVMKPMGRKIIWHIGIMVSPSHVLHIEQDAESSCVPLGHDLIKPRLVSFHRHPKLA